MFTKDIRTETFLGQMGVSFRYTGRLAFGDLAKGWDQVNLGRPKPLLDEAIMEYAALMEGGSPAPAPILRKGERGYEVLDGMQRVSAAILHGSQQLSAYVVACDNEDTLAAIRVLANARLQGRAEPLEWTKRRAVEALVVQRGMSVEAVAKMGGWRAADIQSIADALSYGAAVQAIGGPQLPDTVLEVVSRYASQQDLTSAPQPAAEFLRLVKAGKFSAADAAPYVESFFAPVAKSRKRHEILTSRLEQFKEQPEVQVRIHGRKGQGLSPDVNLRRSLKTVVTVLGEIEQSGATLVYVDEFFKLLGDIDKKLHGLAKSHPKAEEFATPSDKWIK